MGNWDHLAARLRDLERQDFQREMREAFRERDAKREELAKLLTNTEKDQIILTGLALNHEAPQVKRAAGLKLARLLTEMERDQKILMGLATQNEVDLVRQAAGARLAKLLTETEEDQNVLLKLALDSEIDSVRHAAAEKLDDPSLLSELIGSIGKTERLRAVSTLAMIGDAQAVRWLCEALDDSNAEVSSHAAEALGEIGDAEAVEPLLKALKGNDPALRGFAARALGLIGDQRAVGPLFEALGDAQARRSAVEALAAEPLRKIKTSEDFWGLWAAAGVQIEAKYSYTSAKSYYIPDPWDVDMSVASQERIALDAARKLLDILITSRDEETALEGIALNHEIRRVRTVAAERLAMAQANLREAEEYKRHEEGS